MDMQEHYKAMQEEWVKLYKVKKGDELKVLRTFKEGELGCNAGWWPVKEKYIGQTGKLISFGSTTLYLQFNGNDSYYFPFLVLVKIASAPIKEMTVAEICEALGYEVKVIKDDNDC